jgi:hypothetical protein
MTGCSTFRLHLWVRGCWNLVVFLLLITDPAAPHTKVAPALWINAADLVLAHVGVAFAAAVPAFLFAVVISQVIVIFRIAHVPRHVSLLTCSTRYIARPHYCRPANPNVITLWT